MNMLTKISASTSSQLMAKLQDASEAAKSYWARVYKPAHDRFDAAVGECPPCRFTITATSGQVAEYRVGHDSVFPPIGAYDRGRELAKQHRDWLDRYAVADLDPEWQKISAHMDALWDAESEALDAFMAEPAADASILATKTLFALDRNGESDETFDLRADHRRILLADAHRLGGTAIALS